jgi:hypothetical protein
MTTNPLIILAIGIAQIVLIILPFILILYFIIPNRKYDEISENEIDNTIKSLNHKERISFKYKNVRVSLKRDKDKLLIEPYSNKIVESLFKFLGFFLSMFIVIFVLGLFAGFLDSMGVGDKTYSNGYARSVSWSAMLQISAGEIWYVYFIIFYFFGRIIRTKILSKLLYWRHKDNFIEFNLKYSKYRY